MGASDVLESPTEDSRATGDHIFIDLFIFQFFSSSSRKKNDFFCFLMKLKIKFFWSVLVLFSTNAKHSANSRSEHPKRASRWTTADFEWLEAALGLKRRGQSPSPPQAHLPRPRTNKTKHHTHKSTQHARWDRHSTCYGFATISRLLKSTGLFCRILSLLEGTFAKETYNFKEPTNRSQPIWEPWKCATHAAASGLYLPHPRANQTKHHTHKKTLHVRWDRHSTYCESPGSVRRTPCFQVRHIIDCK